MTPEQLRALFPSADRYVQLNNAGVAPISTRVAEAMAAFAREYAEHGHARAAEWARRVERTRRSAARLIGAQPEEIAFVRNTSHGLSLVARGLDWRPGDTVVVPEGEYPSNVYPWMALAGQGVILRRVPVRGGRLLEEDWRAALTPGTRLVSVSSMEYLNGWLNDLDALSAMVRPIGAWLCVDLIQTLGVHPLDVSRTPIDFGAADAHKWLMGPEGIGIFYARRERIAGLQPALVGWNSVIHPLVFHEIDYTLKPDAARFEEGSMPVGMILALEAALDLIEEIGVKALRARIDYLIARLIEAGRRRGWEFLTPVDRPDRHGGVVSFRIPGVETARTVQGLTRRGILVADRAGWIRVSPHAFNNETDIDALLAALPDA